MGYEVERVKKEKRKEGSPRWGLLLLRYIVGCVEIKNEGLGYLSYSKRYLSIIITPM